MGTDHGFPLGELGELGTDHGFPLRFSAKAEQKPGNRGLSPILVAILVPNSPASLSRSERDRSLWEGPQKLGVHRHQLDLQLVRQRNELTVIR